MFLSRGLRLVILTIIAAAIFPGARLILGSVLFFTLLVKSFQAWKAERAPYLMYLLVFFILIITGYIYSVNNVKEVQEYRLTNRPIGESMKKVADGEYQGEGKGYRGPIKVLVQVQDGAIKNIELLYYRDLAAVKATTLEQLRETILETGRIEKISIEPDLLRGAYHTSFGYLSAIENALVKGIQEYPRVSFFAKAFLNTFIGVPPDRFTIHALAILFAVFLVFDYTVQSVLTRDTGHSLTCYNCATCVGACPVKTAEGFQFPMDLVLATRLGDYETVERLSKYCVGCGKCAAKCPGGNSGPSVISAAIQANKKLKGTSVKKKKAA